MVPAGDVFLACRTCRSSSPWAEVEAPVVPAAPVAPVAPQAPVLPGPSPWHHRRKFRSQTSDKMDRWKSRAGKSQRREEKRSEAKGREEDQKIRRKTMQAREKVEKSRNTMVFPMFCGSGGSKSRLAKAAGAEPCGQMRWKKCTPVWREAHFEVKMYKAHQLRTTFRSCDVGKVHAVVARSTFRSQNVQNTLVPEHFWKLSYRKGARRCGVQHISKSKCTKDTILEHFLKWGCGFVWQARRFCTLSKVSQTWGVLQQLQKRWEAWDIWTGSAKMHACHANSGGAHGAKREQSATRASPVP